MIFSYSSFFRSCIDEFNRLLQSIRRISIDELKSGIDETNPNQRNERRINAMIFDKFSMRIIYNSTLHFVFPFQIEHRWDGSQLNETNLESRSMSWIMIRRGNRFRWIFNQCYNDLLWCWVRLHFDHRPIGALYVTLSLIDVITVAKTWFSCCRQWIYQPPLLIYTYARTPFKGESIIFLIARKFSFLTLLVDKV